MGARLSRAFQRRRLIRLLIGFGVVIAAWLIVSFVVASRLTARSKPIFDEPIPEVTWGLLESQRLQTRDGQEIGAWYAQGRDDQAPSILILHGNGGSRWNSLSRASVLAEQGGCSVLLISLRAHGDSTGDYNDIGLSARQDVIAAVEFLEHRRPGRPIIVQGVSMGGAAATFAAEELGQRVQGYILENPYRDLKTAVRHRTEAYLPPLLDQVAYLGLRLVSPLVMPELSAIAPIEAISKIPEDVPVLILAGGLDRLARPEEAQALHDRIQSHSQLVIFENANHHNLATTNFEHYVELLLHFCRTVTSPPSF